MSDALQKSRLLKRLRELFPNGFNAPQDRHKHSDALYLELLPQVLKHIKFQGNIPSCVPIFLYSGCLVFDRFTAPTPFVVDLDYYTHLEAFVSALNDADHGNPVNSAVFRLRIIRAKMYKELDGKPYDSIGDQLLNSYYKMASLVKLPGHPEKQIEFQEEANKLFAIINGISNGTLKTKLKFRIPFVMHVAPLTINFTWQLMPAHMQITPRFQKTNESSFLNWDGAAQSVGPSRWATGHSEIELEIFALVDCDAFTNALQGLHKEEFPIEGWPKCFSLAFKITRDVAWQLRLHHDGEKQWIPTPRDISDIEWSLETEFMERIDWKRKCSPAELINVFTPTSEKLNLNLGEVNEPLWSEQCRSLAIMYFEMGQNEESLFWLNVGVEAVFEERFEDIAISSGIESLEKDLKSPKAFWSQAEEIVANQYPELSGKIEWPNNEVHVSIYSKLKYLYKVVPMLTAHRDLLQRYSKIQRHRNDLFHGRKGDPVSVEILRIAIESFDWILENFRIE